MISIKDLNSYSIITTEQQEQRVMDFGVDKERTEKEISFTNTPFFHGLAVVVVRKKNLCVLYLVLLSEIKSHVSPSGL